MQPRDLSDHVEYQAGRGIEEVARELGRDPAEFVKLASNENMHGPSPAAVAALEEAASGVHHYPTAVHADLTGAIAAQWAVTPEQVWLGNGGDGVLDYLSRAFIEPGDTVLVPSPGFTYYGMAARFHHGDVAEYTIDRDEGFQLTADAVLDAYDGERIVYLTSPHNPSGGRFSLTDVQSIADETRDDTLVVVDEAYGEFAEARSAISMLEDRDDIAVLRTFSKVYGLAGVRLGYGIVPTEWADAYARVNTPFAASALACQAGLAAIDDHEHVERTVETARWAREYMADNVEAETYESHANFVLVNAGDASEVTTELKHRGIIVRDCTSFGLPDCIRITCGTKAETKRAVRELNEVLQS